MVDIVWSSSAVYFPAAGGRRPWWVSEVGQGGGRVSGAAGVGGR